MKRSRARILMFVLAYPIMAREVLHALHCQTLSLPSSAWVLAQLEGVFLFGETAKASGSNCEAVADHSIAWDRSLIYV